MIFLYTDSVLSIGLYGLSINAQRFKLILGITINCLNTFADLKITTFTGYFVFCVGESPLTKDEITFLRDHTGGQLLTWNQFIEAILVI
ncbi:hypothetical protein [Nostoc sp.]|uniref:hypothetical protein n=1 Tax=Nostoc sp. TaxID=1180 RepID=UPI002FF50C2A